MGSNRHIERIAWVAALCWGVSAVAQVQSVDSAAGTPAVVTKPAQAAMTVDRAVMAVDGSMLEVHFTVAPAPTTQWIPTDRKDTYVVNEATGEKFFVLNLVRIGPASPVRMPKSGGSSYVIIDNRYEHLKAGATITVVIGALKQEHVKVAER